MPSGRVEEDGSFKEFVDYPDVVVVTTYSDSPCGRAEEAAAVKVIPLTTSKE